jgi:hypothetical protein
VVGDARELTPMSKNVESDTSSPRHDDTAMVMTASVEQWFSYLFEKNKNKNKKNVIHQVDNVRNTPIRPWEVNLLTTLDQAASSSDAAAW